MSKLDLDLVSKLDPDAYYNMNFGVMDFAADLKAEVRGILTAPRSGDSVWVYREQDTYPMGYISYANRMDKADGEQRYNVFSPNIKNGKYQYGDRKYMSSATDRAKAVKNAAKYLRPLTVEQVIERAQDSLVDKTYAVQGQARKDAHGATVPITQNLFEFNSYGDPRPNALQKELWHLLQSGYQFVDKEVEETLRAAFTALEDFKDSKVIHNRNYIFVEVVQFRGQTVFRGFDDVTNNRHVVGYGGRTGEQFVYQQDQLPEHIAEKLALLSMVDVDQYVTGVGYRSASNLFYLAKEE